MSLDTAFALVSFAFVMSISPGPANFLLLASGANFGLACSIPLILGISFGFLAMVFLVGIGLGQILQAVPELYTALKFVCAAYVLWLAWKIAWSRTTSHEQGETVDQPISFLQAALFQLVNPKAWAVALIVTISYTRPDAFLSSLIMMIIVFALVNLPSISVWALFGVVLRQHLVKGNRIALFNGLMALLLVVSMTPVLLRP